MVRILHTNLIQNQTYLMLGTEFSILKLTEETRALTKFLPVTFSDFPVATELSAIKVGRIRRRDIIVRAK